jgi:hypothetical protein
MCLLRYSILLVAALPVILSAQNHTPLKLWYDKPAANRNEALPIGNGRLAAMLFGDPENERIDLNSRVAREHPVYLPYLQLINVKR